MKRLLTTIALIGITFCVHAQKALLSNIGKTTAQNHFTHLESLSINPKDLDLLRKDNMKNKLIGIFITCLIVSPITFGQNRHELVSNILMLYSVIDNVNKNVYFLKEYKPSQIDECFKNQPVKRLQELKKIIEIDSMQLQPININLIVTEIGLKRTVSTEKDLENIPLLYNGFTLPFEKQYDDDINNFYQNVFNYNEPESVLEIISNELQSSAVMGYSKTKVFQKRKKSLKLLAVYEGKNYIFIIYKLRIIPSVDEQYITSELMLK